MASQVSIINAALFHLGGDRISAPTDKAEGARVMTDRWDLARDATLRAHPWNFAMRRALVAAEATTPAFGFAYQYKLPTDPYCLRALMINEDPREKFMVEGRRLLCDLGGPLKLRFISRVTLPDEFDPIFAEALALRLAAATAYKLTGSKGLGPKLLEAFGLFIREARSVDGQEGADKPQFSDEFLGARR